MDVRLAVLETDVKNIKGNIGEIKITLSDHFKWGAIIAGTLASLFIYGYLRLDDRLSAIEVSNAKIEENLKVIKNKVENIPTKDGMIGIMHQVLDSREQRK